MPQGVLADNLIHIADLMAAKPATVKTAPQVGFPFSLAPLPVTFSHGVHCGRPSVLNKGAHP
jgi:hypothetical protein